MNDHLRRLLSDEAQDDEPLRDVPKPPKKSAKKPAPTDRRQADKAWGRAMAKFHRQRAKEQRRSEPR